MIPKRALAKARVDAGFRKRSCSTNDVERDDDSKISHHARERRTLVTMTDSAPPAERKAVPAPRKKGAPVWLDMDQAELDAAYDQSKYAPNQALVQARRVVLSQRART